MYGNSPLVSFVVLSWNTLNDTKAALQSIRNQYYKNYELIVLDNGSTDGSKEYLAQQKDIIFIDLPKNRGFTGGQIEAIKKASGEYIALINSDSVIANDWCQILVHSLEKDFAIAVAGGRSYSWNDDEEPFDTTNRFYSYQVVNLITGGARTLKTGQQKLFVDTISGSGVLIRKSIIDKLGYFDDIFFAYFEETDLFARFKRAGYEILYEPSAHTWHKIGASSKGKAAIKSYSYFYLYQMQRNRFLFAYKNFDRKYARRFLWQYTKGAVVAHYQLLRTRYPEHKAYVAAYWWNFGHFIETSIKRGRVQALGKSYSNKLLKRKIATDVTVIIPCYNYANFVVEAIESVLNQTLLATRIILINDGSTDDSLKVVQKYKNKIEIIDQPNAGVVATKNRALALVDTTWTIFFDADDVINKDYIEQLLARAQRDMSDVVYTDMQYFGAKTGLHAAKKFTMNSLLAGNYIHNSALISTDYLQEIGGYKDEMAGGYEDWELYITLAEAGAKFSYLPKAIFQYRQKEISRNVQAEESAYKLLLTVKKLHAESYKHYNHSFKKLSMRIGRLVKNPYVFIVVLYAFPIAIGSGIKGFFKNVKASFVVRIKKYLDCREEMQKIAEENE